MLDLFFRKYAWTANLALLFAAAWLCARTVNTVVGALIRPRPAVDLGAAPAAPPRPAVPPRLDPDRLSALVGQKPPPPPAAPDAGGAQAAAPRNCSDGAAPPVKSGLRAQLVGAVIADRPRASIASITDLSSRETRVFGVGDDVHGAKLLSVERLRDDAAGEGGFKVVAIVCRDGQKEYLDFQAGDGAAPAPAVATAVRGDEGGAPSPTDGVKKLAENRYEVKKKYIDETLSNLNAVATQARIVPSFKNGVANGFKLFSIQPNSLYSAIGVENGDVIQRINGYEMNSPDKALEIYQKLKDSSHISIEIDRNGQTRRMDYDVRP
jgi:general secretion pathway protein C